MSDGSCYDCDKSETCNFYELSYNCYLKEVLELKEKLTEDDVKLLQSTLARVNTLCEKMDAYDDFSTVIYHINEILNKYNKEL